MQGLRDEAVTFRDPDVKVLDVIRERTRGLHDRLEASFDLSRWLSSRESYRSLLMAYLGIYRPFERMVAQHHPSVAQRHTATLLEKDLRVLGATESEIGEVPECGSDLAGFADRDCLFGGLYVLEGSNLGGQMIYRQIESSLAVAKDTGASFFYGNGERTGVVWKAFLSELERSVVSAGQAAEGACAMFHLFESWLPQAVTREGVHTQ